MKTKNLTDTGVSAPSFVNSLFVKQYKILTVPLIKPLLLRLVDNKLVP